MFAAESYTSRHYIAIVAMACLCVLLGGPSYAAGAESLIIAGATYYEPGVSGPGWAWTDADHLELNGYAGDAIGADGDLVVTLTGQNTVVETSAPDVDISRCGMEVWGDLTLRGTGSLVATGSQCGIYVSGTLAVDGCKVDARADGAGIADARVAGVIADGLAVRGGGRVVAAGAGSVAGVRAYGVCLLGGAFGAGGVVDADGSVAAHVTIEPVDTTASAGETGGPEVPGGAGEPTGGAGPTVEQPGAEPATDPVLKPATTTPKTTTATKTTVTRTAVSAPSKAKTATAAAVTLPKTADSNRIAASLALFLLGTALLGATRRC